MDIAIRVRQRLTGYSKYSNGSNNFSKLSHIQKSLHSKKSCTLLVVSKQNG